MVNGRCSILRAFRLGSADVVTLGNSPWAGRFANSEPRAARTPRKPRKPRAPRNELPEWMIQAHMVAEFNRLEDAGWELSAAADMNAGKRGLHAAAVAKAMGMKKGEADVRLYASGGRIFHIEVKTVDGVISEDQEKRHARLRALGHRVFVPFLGTPAAARDYARSFAIEHVGAPA